VNILTISCNPLSVGKVTDPQIFLIDDGRLRNWFSKVDEDMWVWVSKEGGDA
jgi:hypothetical protein